MPTRRLDWKSSAGSVHHTFNRHCTTAIEGGRGELRIEVYVPGAIWPQPQLTFSFTKTVGTKQVHMLWQSARQEAAEAKFHLLRIMKQLGHPSAEGITKELMDLLVRDAQPIRDALHGRSNGSKAERLRQSRLRLEDPEDYDSPKVSDRLTNFGQPDVVSRSGRSGRPTSLLARTKKSRRSR